MKNMMEDFQTKRMEVPQVASKCPTCEYPNPSLANCRQCNQPTMCTMCESAGICEICRSRVKKGDLRIEKTDEPTETVSDEERNEARKTAYDVLSKLHGAVPVLVPPLKALTKLTEADFDELMGSIRGR